MSSYAPGLLVQATRTDASMDIERGAQLRIESVDGDRVMVRATDGRLIGWRPDRHTSFASFEVVPRRFAAGERVQFTHGDTALGVGNRDFATGLSAGDGRIEVRMATGRRVAQDARHALHLDHGYATTTYGARGATVDRVTVEIDTRSAATNAKRSTSKSPGRGTRRRSTPTRATGWRRPRRARLTGRRRWTSSRRCGRLGLRGTPSGQRVRSLLPWRTSVRHPRRADRRDPMAGCRPSAMAEGAADPADEPRDGIAALEARIVGLVAVAQECAAACQDATRRTSAAR